MGAAVELRDHLMPLDSERGLELITDLARYAEGLVDEAAVKKIYRFSDEDWDRMGSNDELVEKIQAEKTRRIRNGSSARERAQTLFAEAPAVLGTILHGDDVSPRHKIESARELRAIAANGPEATAPETRFIISIDLGGGEVLRFNKSIECTAHDVEDPDNPDTNIDADDRRRYRWRLGATAAKNNQEMAAVASLFERLAQERPQQEPTPPPTPVAAGMLLGWLQNNWKQPTIRARDIHRLGPNPIRDRESAIKTAEVLVRRGWLVPMKPHRYDTKRWRIAIGPD